jgi:hypothetical protein
MLIAWRMAGGARATPVYRTSCTLGWGGLPPVSFYHHGYMYYQKTIHIDNAPIRPRYNSSIELQGRNGHLKHRGVWKYFNYLKYF